MEPAAPSRGRQIRRRLRQRRAAQLVVCLAAVSLVVPVLFAKASAEAQNQDAGAETTNVVQRTLVSTADPSTTSTTLAPVSTTPATAAPTSARPVTTAQTASTAAPTTTAPAPPSTAPPTTAPPATVAPTTAAPSPPPSAAPSPANSESGIASYYDDPNNGCAHKTLPFGTVVHISASNGRTATCVVDDRGPFGPGRILDLDTDIFAQLAPLSSGVISVTATW